MMNEMSTFIQDLCPKCKLVLIFRQSVPCFGSVNDIIFM